jgi:hypothetical protein
MVAKAAMPHFSGSVLVSGSSNDMYGGIVDFAAAKKRAEEIFMEIRLLVRASRPVLAVPAKYRGATA